MLQESIILRACKGGRKTCKYVYYMRAVLGSGSLVSDANRVLCGSTRIEVYQ